MRPRNVIVGMFVLAIVLGVGVISAEAQVLCFADQDGNTFRLEVGASSGTFFLLGGQYTSGTLRSPVSAVAHLRSDGRAQVGFTIHSSDSTNFPIIGQATLNAPGFNSGTGSQDSLGGTFKTLSLTGVLSCPAVQ